METTVLEPGPEPTRVAGSGLQVWELVNEVTDTRDLMIAYAIIPPGGAEGPHARDTDEFIYYLSGTATVRIEGGEEIELRPGQMIRIPPGVSHSHANTGDEPVVQLFFRASPVG
jgi:mannose-6-phosphate isomerase-like protein (cupin superfamily)